MTSNRATLSRNGRAEEQSVSDPPGNPLLVSATDFLRLLNVPVRTIWRQVSAGQLPVPVRISRCVRWQDREIVEWMEARCPYRAMWEARRHAWSLPGPGRFGLTAPPPR